MTVNVLAKTRTGVIKQFKTQNSVSVNKFDPLNKFVFLHRMIYTECDPNTCPCGDLCGNQRLQKYECVEGLHKFPTEGRGVGVRTAQDIFQGKLRLPVYFVLPRLPNVIDRVCSQIYSGILISITWAI